MQIISAWNFKTKQKISERFLAYSASFELLLLLSKVWDCPENPFIFPSVTGCTSMQSDKALVMGNSVSLFNKYQYALSLQSVSQYVRTQNCYTLL